MNGQPETWVAVGLLAVSNVGIWIDKIMTGIKARKNNGQGNGMAMKVIQQNENRITILEVCVENVEKELGQIHSENREDHKSIFEKLETIKDRNT